MSISIIPQVGEIWEYEAEPYSSAPRWSLRLTAFGSTIWHDAGTSTRWEECKVIQVKGSWMTVENSHGDFANVPINASSQSFRDDQWSYHGFFRPKYASRKLPEEECPGCHRMKDVGLACWCCGGGNPNIDKAGFDKRKSRYST